MCACAQDKTEVSHIYLLDQIRLLCASLQPFSSFLGVAHLCTSLVLAVADMYTAPSEHLQHELYILATTMHYNVSSDNLSMFHHATSWLSFALVLMLLLCLEDPTKHIYSVWVMGVSSMLKCT